MGSGLLCLLLLNTALSENAFHEQSLRAQAAKLSDEKQALDLRADNLSAPSSLAARASALGMQPGGLPSFVAPGAPLPAGARAIPGGAAGGTLYVVPTPVASPTAATNAGQLAAAPSAAAGGARGTAAASSTGAAGR
jgi:hypothetical protein